jgi:hypothetical protein
LPSFMLATDFRATAVSMLAAGFSPEAVSSSAAGLPRVPIWPGSQQD